MRAYTVKEWQALFERGAVKVDQKGRHYVQVPTAVRRNGRYVVPKAILKRFKKP